MNHKENIKDLRSQLEILNQEMNSTIISHEKYIHKIEEIKGNIKGALKIEEEKLKEYWIKDPNFLVLSVDGFCLHYECEWKKHESNQWRKGYIVGTSYDTAKRFKVKTSIKGDNYEWACQVRIDPEELKITIKENTRRMLSQYNIYMENYEYTPYSV